MSAVTRLTPAEARAVEQESRDAQHRANRYTGPDWDAVYMEYVAWCDGRVLGYARDQAGAQKLVSEQVARNLHVGARR